ncbi:distal tail protein Dit [Cytobacillus horneckiae]|uniref:distal tail protein Dit n=1 Tax=Cytobacillus horneckiae TaxID=549687 RepID=UPI003D9AADDB
MSFLMEFNGNVLPIKILDVHGRGPLVQEVTRNVVSGQDGSYFIKRRLPDRSLSVSFMIPNAKSLNELRKKTDDLSRLLYVDHPSKIVFSDESNRYYRGILDGEPDWDELMSYGIGTLPFIREPFKYGDRVNLHAKAEIQNEGTNDASPVFKVVFKAAVDEFIVSHQETGGSVRVIWNFVAGDKLIIDLEKRKIIINGNVRMDAYDWRNQPFKLKAGANNVQINHESEVDVEVEFTPRWI